MLLLYVWLEPQGIRATTLHVAETLFGGQYHHHRPPLELGILLHYGNLFQFGGDVLQQLPSAVGKRNLPAPKHHGDLDFVFATEKLADVTHFRLEIVLTGFGSHLDFFDLKRGLFLFGLLLLLGLLVFEPPVVHDLADRRFRIGRDLYQIETIIVRLGQGLMNRKDTNLVAFRIDQANFSNPYTLIDSCGIGPPPVHVSISGTSYAFTS